MPENPVLAYAGPGSRSIAATVTTFDGTDVPVRAAIGAMTSTPGDVQAVWSASGLQAWITHFVDNPADIEFLEFTSRFDGRTVIYRATRGERLSSAAGWDTVRLVLQDKPLVAVGGDFSADDFDPRDWATG